MLCKKILIFNLFFLLFFLSSCKKEEKFLPIIYNLESDPKTLDPQIANDYFSNTLIINLFEGLVRLDKNNKIDKGVAETWESSDNNKTFTFYLKKDVKWSDGKTPVTSKDFLYGIKRAIDPKTSSSTAKLIYIIKNARDINVGEKSMESLGVECLDDFTIIIRLEYGFEDFPRICSLPPMMPCCEDFFTNTSGQYGKSAKTIMSNGPFKLNKNGWDREKSIKLVKNENYIRKDKRAFVPAINFSIRKDSGNKNFAIDLFKKEETDIAYINNPDILEEIKNSGAKITYFKDISWGILFNCSSDIFSNEKIRQSFLGSIDREYLESKIPKNKFAISNNIVLDNMSINGKKYKELVNKDTYFEKLDNVKDLLKEGLSENNIQSLKDAEIYCMDDNEMKIIGNTVLELLNVNLGQNFNIKYLSRNELTSKINAGDFRIALAPLFCKNENPIDFLSYFKSNHEENPAIFKDQVYDNLVKDAENSFDIDMVKRIKQSEEYLSNKAVFYPICSEFSNWVYNDKIKDIIFYPYQMGIDFSFAKKSK